MDMFTRDRLLLLINDEYGDGTKDPQSMLEDAVYVSAANMLQLSSSARPVTVMDGTVHIEDDVPVLDIDKVIESWFMIKANLVRALHPHQAFTAMIVCNSGYDAKLTVDYRFSLGYENETKGAASEPTFNEFLRRVDWTKANEAKVLAIGHSPIERS
jgi:hypothetical protein